ncbi:MAG: hypothetical protein JSW11_06935 [Candidatus Heimdallarchaeota archaeon]|nr:MAG: hypothetical protein JSW11_06935 [Candidatus Heimdallarchaeota archaeon]
MSNLKNARFIFNNPRRVSILFILFSLIFFSSIFLFYSLLSDDDYIRNNQNIWGEPRITFFWQGCNTTFVMSWDDAHSSDINLAPIDEKLGISHTIFSPSYRSYPNRSFWRFAFLLDELFQGYDVQSHCGRHVPLSGKSPEEQEYLIRWGKTGIEELFCYTPIVFAYPYGVTGGVEYVEKYFDLGRTNKGGGVLWPPDNWYEAGTTIAPHGIHDDNIHRLIDIMKKIYRTTGYQVFKGYGHTNTLGKNNSVTNFINYREIFSQIANWPDVWYTSWGELVAYEKEKKNVTLSEVTYSEDKIEFYVSVPSFNTNIYKVPLTVAILIPKSWKNPFPQINGKYTSRFSLKHYADSTELYLDVLPLKDPRKVVIWRNVSEIDSNPPEISNFVVETKEVTQNWDLNNPETLKFTFMRFDVTDELSNVYNVNASVHLKNGDEIIFSNMKNPIFWKNSTYGRVVWDSTIFNIDVHQVEERDIEYVIITVQDDFGNTRQCMIFPTGSQIENVFSGGQYLLRMPDKKRSSVNQLSPA